MNTLLRRASLVLSPLLAPAARAGTLIVDVSRTTGADDGSTWAGAFQGVDGLQDALAVAVAVDQIRVALGAYGDLDGDGLPDECECSGGTPPACCPSRSARTP